MGKRTLAELIRANSAVLEVLDKHGVTFCAGCYLTLDASPDKAASYHAVPDVSRFKKDLEKALKKRKK